MKLMMSFSYFLGSEAPFDTAQIMQRLTKLGKNRPDGDASVVRMIAMVFASLSVDSTASKIAR
jgi:hypothetical protein